MTELIKEKTFESAIIQSLIKSGGYIETNTENFSRELIFDKFVFLKLF